jgi:hypothetical protein
MIRRKIFAALPLIGALTAAQHAQAQTYHLSFGGDGNVSGSATITVGFDSKAGDAFGTAANLVPSPPGYVGIADPVNASLITGVSGGVFSDVALGITDEAITGLVPDNYAPHFAPDQTIPYSFSYYASNPLVSYDNLFYTDGESPQTCTFPPPGNYGGFFDNYGVMFTLANGDVVDLYSNGDIQAVGNPPVTPGLNFYGVVVVSGGVPSYASAGGLLLSVPEPSTWAMMVLGFAGLGFAGYRASRKAASVAA